ncbi:carbon storage regulator CsrA [Fusibacter bizertensis]|jgi:carbon storage regulator (csrA)|uniref:Translational regulator CsrA n=1 Tax=Fusibacter bizertensis TaxID=1488331 RepID=A0ABT6NDU8_9FIRM|nr:carbon storage regulator CsrA [Fusibacter bizertensis]MDH8678583.1 carbon storage regulator CsrA [Fusibacter bizertensis]
MLILTRKKDESIIIDGNIEIQIIAIEEGKVKIGINAPKEIEIHRSEVFDKILEANKAAVNSTGSIKVLSDRMKKNNK